ncbi:hypothetical protein EST38_g10758 [Candolleomyces aberdarensis]|uniref:Uncharacterized protein n=1 Tax=Candolleomyces aberdarensis TaxID=2316362 RepID=A0A4Q2D6K6_9AGAR|nr:hypothetical protein EST38_g10758 [Candolleomyces aberdarensis]
MHLYTGVVAILIESALPLSVFGIIAAALLLVVNSSTSAAGPMVCFYLFDGLFFSFCVLSPHMIIFRVTTGRSFINLPTAKNGVLTNPIQFAHETAQASFLQSCSNRELARDPEFDIERLGGDTSRDTQTPTTARTSQEIIYITEEKRGEAVIEKK